MKVIKRGAIAADEVDEKVTDRDFDKCMRRMKHGDEEGLRLIYEAYNPYIYALAKGYTGRKEDAEDLTEDFFVKLWDIADRYKPGKGHRAWMSTILKNMAVDRFRKYGREIPKDSVCDEEVSEEKTPEERTVLTMTFKQAMENLSAEQQQIVVMKIVGEMTFKEIAQVLGIPMGTVTWRYQKSMELLRKVVV